MVDRASQVKANEVREPSFWISKPSRPLPRTKNFRGYIAEDQALQDRSNAEIRLHEAIEEIYGPDPKPHPLENDKEFDALLDTLFPEQPQETIALPIVAFPTLYQISIPPQIPKKVSEAADLVVEIQEPMPPGKKEIISFEVAKEILRPYIDTYQGKVSVEDFELAYKFFIELGSRDLEQSYLKEKREISKQQKLPLSNLRQLQEKLREITKRIEDEGPDSEILSKALANKGFRTNQIDAMAGSLEIMDEVNQQATSKEKPFTDNFAKIYFFLKELAPKDMPDGTVFDTLARPLFEMIAERSSGDLKKPKRPDPGKIGNKNTLKQKQRTFQTQLKNFEAALAKSIPEIYNFITEKLGGDAPTVISKRLSELKS